MNENVKKAVTELCTEGIKFLAEYLTAEQLMELSKMFEIGAASFKVISTLKALKEKDNS